MRIPRQVVESQFTSWVGRLTKNAEPVELVIRSHFLNL
jgi:hypothetical protein